MTKPITGARTLAELVIEVPSRAAVLEDRGLDYCCAGTRTLESACAEANLEVEQIAAELGAVEPIHAPAPTGIASLIEHILERHHRYLHRELARLGSLATKVLGVHGTRHPDLADLHAAVFALQADLEPHLMKEELVVFPACRALVALDGPSAVGAISNPVRALISDHHGTGALLDRLSEHLDHHPLPTDACASYAALYTAIRALIADTHEHVFEENHLLFPAVLEREQRLRGVTDGRSRRTSA